MSASGVPPHPPPKTAELLAGCLPQPRPPRWPRQLLHSCSQTLAGSSGGSCPGLAGKRWCEEGVQAWGKQAAQAGPAAPCSTSRRAWGGCSEGLGLGKGHSSISPDLRGSAPTQGPLRHGSGPGYGQGGGGGGRVGQGNAACPGRRMWTQLGARHIHGSQKPPQSPVLVRAKATLWVHAEAKDSGKGAIVHILAGS